MNAHFKQCPVTTDADHWLFAGLRIDALVAYSADEAAAMAKELNDDFCEFSVIRFNAVEGTCRDVTHEYLAEEEPDEDEVYIKPRWLDWNRRDAR